MARYRKVDPRIWNDSKFRSMSDNGKLAFFFLLTHPHMTSIGAMRSSIAGLAAEIGWTEKAFREAFAEAFAKGMAMHDEKASLIWLPNFLKYNPPESPNVVKAWVGALELLPECELRSRAVAGCKAFAEALTKGFAEALPEAFAKSMPYQEQEQEQEQNNTHAQKKAREPKPDKSEDFDIFWDAYPRKVGKVEAEKSFNRAKINGKLPDLLNAIAQQKNTDQWKKDGGQFIPNPATWINQRRWEDEVPKPGPVSYVPSLPPMPNML